MNTTKIEWATMTWNPITGCSPISEGCQNCYAERMAHRLAGRCGYDKDKPFGVTYHPCKVDDPRHARNPQRIFVCSMGDLFHEAVQDEMTYEVLYTMQYTPWHKYLILTKRPEIAAHRIARMWDGNPPINLWLGVTAENQRTADERIPVLLSIPAAGHFVSVEPILEPVQLRHFMPHNPPLFSERNGYTKRLDWVIAGAETGPKKRFCALTWIYDLLAQCELDGVPFFGKKDSDGDPIYPRQIPAALNVEAAR